jgi:N-acetylglucosamine-6-phosphate deacetylase
MISKILRAVALLVLSSGATVEAQTTTAIIGARVIDGTGAPARLETVVLQGDRILAVSPNAQIPPGARILDATGQTLMPGLFDLHTHLNARATDAVDDLGKSLKAYLVAGLPPSTITACMARCWLRSVRSKAAAFLSSLG